MDTQLTIKSMQHQNWIEMVQQQIHSGLTVNEWCEKNDINPKTFWYRRRVVRNDLLGASSPFVEIPLPESKKTLPPTASMNTGISSPMFQPVMRIDIFSVARVFKSFSPLSSSITIADLNLALKFLLCLDME